MLKFSGAALAVGLTAGKVYFDSFIPGMIIFVILLGAYPTYKKMEEERRRQKLLLEFKDFLYSISASVSLGRSMGRALEESLDFWGNTYDETDPMVREVKGMIREMKETNATDIKVLRDFAMRSGLPDIVDFVNVYDSLRTTGGNIPKAIGRAAIVIGDKISMDKELNTAMSEKLMEGRIVGLSPFVMTLGMKLVAPGYMSPVYETFAGRMVAALSLGLSAAAIVMIERINRIEF